MSTGTAPIQDLRKEVIEHSIKNILGMIGDDPNREGLKETPARFAKACQEWFAGYAQDPKTVLKAFEDGADQEATDELVLIGEIPFYSHCEHHIALIQGHVWVGYIPDGKIIGLSKAKRLTDVFARRLQVQERLTHQIANSLQEYLKPKGIGVLIRAHHACMESRGTGAHGSLTTTSALRGVMRTQADTRAEFLTLCLK